MKPYLSIVVAARNDNYGGDFRHRVQVFVAVLSALALRHRVQAELIVVEWNPPQDRPSLQHVIDWPPTAYGLAVRFVTVPAEVHRNLPNSSKMPMFEYIAKNVGIRRAVGEFVLVTNPDIVFSDEVLQYFSRGRMPLGVFQRADRYDVGKPLPLDTPINRLLHLCEKHAFRVQGRWGVRDLGASERARELITRMSPRRVLRSLTRRMMKRTSSPTAITPAPGLHVFCPGDFILMARHDWLKLRGFPELPTHSHIDSYMVYLAAYSGLRQVVLPYRIYHQEHGRTEHISRPLTVLSGIPAFNRMLNANAPVITNDENWGLGDVDLPASSSLRHSAPPEVVWATS